MSKPIKSYIVFVAKILPYENLYAIQIRANFQLVLNFPIQGPFKFGKAFIDLHNPSEKFRLVVH